MSDGNYLGSNKIYIPCANLKFNFNFAHRMQ